MSSLTVLFVGLFCIPAVFAASGHCPVGSPLAGAYCGLSPVATACPTGYYCESSPVDAYAECCPRICSVGSPMLDATGHAYHCGRGGIRCPVTYTCEIAPNDAWAVCCPK